jgi:polysaccharide biosynthesis protein PslG
MPRAIAAIVLAACLLAALFGALAAASTAEAKKGGKKAAHMRKAGKKKARVTRFDRDGDGIRNGRDRNVDGDRRRNVVDPDVDGDGRRNDYDHDIDGDGVKNAFDADSDASGDQFRASAATAQAPPGFVGLVSDDAFWGTDADPSRAGTMAAIAGTGARVLRQSFYWSMIERQPGQYDFSLYDAYVASAARANLSILPILFDPPAFRSARPAEGARRGTYPPANYTDFAVFAAALVRRYGPNGDFWRAHPELPQLPIRSWQVWNEPNIPVYWPTGPNPAEYAAMLRTVGEGIKAVDPGARVITAGLNESELGIKLVPFLQGMYRAGAKGSFDVLALHPYAPGSDLVTAQLNRAIKELRRNGDPARTIVTELGWATGGPSQRALVVSELGQAALIRRTITRLARYRGQLRLEGVFYFNWRDVAAAPGSRDHWGLHTGLLREDGSVKPGMQALTDVTRAISFG